MLRYAMALLVLLGCCAGEDETSSSSTSTSSNGGASTSTSSSSAGGGTSGDPIATWCDAVGAPYCEAQYACCTSMTGTVEACKTEWAAECEGNLARDVGPVLSSGASQLNAARLQACVDKLEMLASGACTEPPNVVFLMECVAAFEGQVAPGAPCVTTPDDISYVECSHGLCQNGACVAFKQEGEACTLTGSGLCDYTNGLWCAFDGMTASCAMRGDIGAPCTTDPVDPAFECKSLVCDASGMCGAATLEALCSSAH